MLRLGRCTLCLLDWNEERKVDEEQMSDTDSRLVVGHVQGEMGTGHYGRFYVVYYMIWGFVKLRWSDSGGIGLWISMSQ